jgi:hypothetical protein
LKCQNVLGVFTTMTIRRVYVGSLGPHLYRDDDPIGDPDEHFPGETQYALASDGDILIDDIYADDIYADIVTINLLKTKGLAVGITTVNGDYVISGGTDAIILVDTDDGVITITLPSLVAIPGRIFWIKNIGSKKNIVKVDGYEEELVEGLVVQNLHDGDTGAIAAGPSQWRFI